MSRQYHRSAQVRIAGQLFATRISFEIRKGEQGSSANQPGAQSNKSTVSIWNLSEASRGLIEREVGKGGMVLEAGYGGVLANLFTGDIALVEMKRIGPDIETRIEAGDGERNLVDAHIELSLGPGATDSQIIDSALDALGLGRGMISGMPSARRSNGFTYSGPAKDLIDQIARKNGLAWSVQGGAVQIRQEGTTSGMMAILLTEQTGLIGIPNKTEEGFKAECLLNPDIEPGRLVKIQSALLTNETAIEVKGVEHMGDTHGDKWQTTIWGVQA